MKDNSGIIAFIAVIIGFIWFMFHLNNFAKEEKAKNMSLLKELVSKSIGDNGKYDIEVLHFLKEEWSDKNIDLVHNDSGLGVEWVTVFHKNRGGESEIIGNNYYK